MRAVALAAIVVTATISPLAAQGSTAELLGQAHEFYERLEVERALPLLRQIVSPNWPFEVTREQRVEAYKYLGACLTLAGKRDSAVLFFRAAIERDPFTELDPNLFTPAQLATFGEAQRRTFAVAVRPVASARVDPRTARVTFTIVVTHAALVDVKLSAVGTGPRQSLFQGTMDGVREITWDGLFADRRLAPQGRYALAVAGRSRLTGTSDSARVYFDLRHEVAPLEDTLPALDRGALLPERISPEAARRDVAKGLGVAAAALVIAGAANGDLGGGEGGGAGVVGGAAPAGAQRALTVAPLVSLVEHRVDAGFGVERSLGPIVGAVGTLRVGPRLEAAVRAVGGRLIGSTGVLDRDVGELGVEASVVTVPWLVLQAGAARRAYSTKLGRQTWTLVGLGAKARMAFAGDAIHSVWRAALLPPVSASGLRGPDTAVRAATGLEYRVRTMTLCVEYSLERYDFPAEAGVRRLEQLSAVTLLLELRLR